MIEMFRYLIKIQGKEEKKKLVLLAILDFVSPVFDLFSFSVIIIILNQVINEGKVSLELIVFTAGMGIISLLKGFFELYKCWIQNQFVNFGAQKLAIKIFELFQKEELIDHNKKSPMQALTMIKEDTASCIGIITACLTLWINSMTLFGYIIILVYVSHMLV